MTYAKIAAAILLALGLAGGGWYVGHRNATLKAQAQIAAISAAYADASQKAEAAARKAEEDHTAEVAQIESTYQQDMTDAQSKADRTIADLRSGNLRLRKEWQCPSDPGVPQAGTGSGGSDEAADQRAADSAALVRIAEQADAQIKALQALLKADRELIK